MKNEIELYVNKKFDIPQIIKMVLKRKNWGEVYTLYKSKNFEVLATMESFNFKESYATFNIKVNEQTGSNYSSENLYIYVNREDYTIEFINKLLLKKIKSVINDLVREIASNEFSKLMRYPYMHEKSEEQWIKIFGIEDEIEKIKELDIDEEFKESCVETMLDNYHNEYLNDHYYTPRNNFINNKIKNDFPVELSDILEEIENDMLKIDKGVK